MFTESKIQVLKHIRIWQILKTKVRFRFKNMIYEIQIKYQRTHGKALATENRAAGATRSQDHVFLEHDGAECRFSDGAMARAVEIKHLTRMELIALPCANRCCFMALTLAVKIGGKSDLHPTQDSNLHPTFNKVLFSKMA